MLTRKNLEQISTKIIECQPAAREIEWETSWGRADIGRACGAVAVLVCGLAGRTRELRCRC